MFKQLLCASAATLGFAVASTDATAEVGAKQACSVYVPNEFTMWDLSKLEKLDGSPNDHGDYHAWGLEWNFCRYLDDGESSYFARKLSMTRGAERLTNDDYTPSETVSLKDEEGNYTGVSVTHSSNNFCKRNSFGEDVNYSFTTVVMCDKEITA